jgi:hypothetical protein
MQPEITLGVPASLLRNRPDVIAAEYNLITNFEMTNVAKWLYPSLKSLRLRISKYWFKSAYFCQYHYWVNATYFNQRQVRTKFEVAKANQEKHIYSLNNRYLPVKKFQML